jgi:hypothetical protein
MSMELSALGGMTRLVARRHTPSSPSGSVASPSSPPHHSPLSVSPPTSHSSLMGSFTPVSDQQANWQHYTHIQNLNVNINVGEYTPYPGGSSTPNNNPQSPPLGYGFPQSGQASSSSLQLGNQGHGSIQGNGHHPSQTHHQHQQPQHHHQQHHVQQQLQPGMGGVDTMTEYYSAGSYAGNGGYSTGSHSQVMMSQAEPYIPPMTDMEYSWQQLVWSASHK